MRRLLPLALFVSLTGVALGQAPAEHVVRAGDTLTAVARAHGTTVQELMHLNRLSTTSLQVGQRLAVPGSAPPRLLEHLTTQDDTLQSLAARYGLPEQVLREANPAFADALGDLPLGPGFTLLIPPGDGRVVWLAPGETLLSVALEHGLAPSDLARRGAQSQAGAVFIPTALLTAPATTAPTPAQPALGPDLHAATQRALLEEAALYLARYQPPPQTFAWPLRGTLSSGYGRRNISVGGNTFHGGLDIVAPEGTPVAAARGGVVTRAGWGGVYGYVVYLEHGDGSETRYGHLSAIGVAPQQAVAQGQVVGLVGSTGASTGPHLHFEIRFGGRTVDPLGYLP